MLASVVVAELSVYEQTVNNLIKIEPLTGAVGANISGVDLRYPLSKDNLTILWKALGEYGVLFFREQDLSPEQEIAFAEQWGKININRFFTAVSGYPKIAQVLKEPNHEKNIGSTWHTDHSYDQIPAMGSILFALEVPRTGGDTLFANMYKAFNGLSNGLQKTLLKMRAIHSSRNAFGYSAKRHQENNKEFDTRIGNPEAATQDAIHPVIITHPISGKHALYINRSFTLQFEGWTKEESTPLLEYLYLHAEKAEFTARFKWEKGCIAFWDNRATWHKALNDYPGQRRYMHRITLEGVALGNQSS